MYNNFLKNPKEHLKNVEYILNYIWSQSLIITKLKFVLKIHIYDFLKSVKHFCKKICFL